MRRLEEARKWSEKALVAKDQDEAVRYWQKIFGGEFFPSDVSEAAKNIAMNHWPGKSHVLPSGLVVPSASRGFLPNTSKRSNPNLGPNLTYIRIIAPLTFVVPLSEFPILALNRLSQPC